MAFVSHHFRGISPGLGGSLRKRDVAAIEFLLRRMNRMKDSYESTSVRNVAPPGEAWDWPRGWIAKGGRDRPRAEVRCTSATETASSQAAQETGQPPDRTS
jgi:succinate dehydrogenase assembly factor 1